MQINYIMKKTNILIPVIVLLFYYLSVSAQQQFTPVPGRYSQFSSISDDSLLFDGEFGTGLVRPYSGDCPVTVRYASGKNTGVKRVDKIVTDCSGKVIDTLYTSESGQLKKDDMVYLGEELSTGEDGVIELEIWDGSVLRMAPNTSIKITGEFCDTRNIFQRQGNIWTKVKKLLGGGKFQVSDKMMGVGVRGTEFSFYTDDTKSIVKVYEGTVETKPVIGSNVRGTEDIAKEMEKLEKEYADGKITMNDYAVKMQDLALKMQGNSQNMSKTVMVEAGYMVTSTDKLGDPEKIPADDNKWFEDSKFYK
jgi:hypothetical protein